MFSKLTITCFYITLLFITFGEASIVSITSMETIEQVLEDINENTLVVFDVDRTLLKMNDYILINGKSGFFKENSYISQLLRTK